MFKLFRNVPNSYKIYDYIPSTKKNIKNLKIKLLNKEINNHDIILTETNDIDNTCYNTLNYSRKLMILNLN